jgi:hypothetical protein
VKSAWRSVRRVHIEDLVLQARRFRPERVILAVMEKPNGRRFESDIDAAKQTLAAEGITFELMTPATPTVDDAPFLLG